MTLAYPIVTVICPNYKKKWCEVNKVTINPEKSIAVIIPPNLCRSHSTAEVTLMLNNVKISPYLKAKYLSLIIDHKLNIQPHILSLEKKIKQNRWYYLLTQTLSSTRNFQQLYFALIQSQLLYSIIIWGSTFPSYLNRLTILHNRAMYHVEEGDYRLRVTPLFVRFQILKFIDLFKFETAKFMHKFMINELPSTFADY